MKKVLPISIISILLVLLIIISVSVNNNKRNIPTDNKVNEYNELINDIDNTDKFKQKNTGKVQKITSISDYELAYICISKFYNYYAMMYDEIINENPIYNNDYYSQKVYNMLSKQYKEKYNISKDNIKEKLDKIEYLNVEIYTLYYITNYEDSKVYYIEGLLRNENTYEIKDFKNIVYINNANQTFTVSLENDIKESVIVGNDVNYILDIDIEKNEDNTFSYPKTSYEEFAERITNSIRHLVLNNPEIAYKLLTDNSKEKYKNINEFKAFINENRKDLFLFSYEKIEKTYINNTFTIKVYDKNSKFIISLFFDSFSNFKYEINKL